MHIIITTIITITRTTPATITMARKIGPSTKGRVVEDGGEVEVAAVLVVDDSEMTGSTYFMHLSMISFSSRDGVLGREGEKNACNWSICSFVVEVDFSQMTGVV